MLTNQGGVGAEEQDMLEAGSPLGSAGTAAGRRLCRRPLKLGAGEPSAPLLGELWTVLPLISPAGGSTRGSDPVAHRRTRRTSDEELPSDRAHYLAAAVYGADCFYETVIKSSRFLELLSKRGRWKLPGDVFHLSNQQRRPSRKKVAALP